MHERHVAYVYYPAKVDSSFVKDGATYINVMIRVPNLLTSQFTWEKSTQDYLENYCLHILSSLAKKPDLKKYIETTERFTPMDFEETFHCTAGATFGLKHTTRRSEERRVGQECSD